MQSLLEEIVRRCGAGEAVALCTVVGARGSTPQSAGARMLLMADGRQVGTLGGGCVEAEVRSQAFKILADKQSRLLSFKLDHDYGWDDGLICGGSMDIYVQTLAGREAARPFELAIEALRGGKNSMLEIEYEDQERMKKKYSEVIEPPAKLVIAGAGHVGQALARIAAELEFDVTVIDDRADCASEDRFPKANRVVGDIETELRRWPIDGQTYVVIVTRGHRHDGKALGAVIGSKAKYLGLIGSKRKVKTIFEDLATQGAGIEKLINVHAPIGLEIGAVTVPEIAVSIAAELVAVRRGHEATAGQAMKFDPQKLKTLLSAEG
jgi:xanthine dehydrogenase accessory factor